MNSPVSSLPVAITMGDPAGIGPEIIAQVFRTQPTCAQRCLVVGDVQTMRRAIQITGGGLPVLVVEQVADLADVPLGCMPVLPVVQLPELLPWGRVDARAGQAAAAAIAWAARAALAGQVRAVVTAPIHKEAFAAAGIAHPGHTEFLQALAAEHVGADVPVRMMLSNDELRTVLVSIHVALRQALQAVTCANVLQTIQITAAHLALQLGRVPKIAVAGLNPHAGEGGLFGHEETEHIVPAIQQACALGHQVSGPYAPDTVFMRARTGEFDVVIAMYHDQGLIPVKYLGLEHGVNSTLGLPFIRTSPDHGTAFDLAGHGVASPSSLLAALRAAGGV